MTDTSTVDGRFGRRFLSTAALFFLLGFQYSTWAARLPAIAGRLGLGSAEVGLLLLACGVGAVVSYPLVTLLMARLGSRDLSCLAALVLGFVLVALPVVADYPAAVATLFVDGVAVACLNVAMNAQGAALEDRYGRPVMARLHASFSGGSLVAALVAAGVAALTPSVSGHFWLALAVVLVLVACARPGLLAENQAPVKKERGRRRAPSAMTLLLGCAMVFGTVTEGAMNDWSALYLRNSVHASVAVEPMGIAVVSVMMVLARLFADGWRSRWGDGRVVLVGTALAALGLAVGVLLGGVLPALVGFACVGLGVAAVTPCVYVAAARQGPDALTFVAGMGTVGLLAGPPAIGLLAAATTLAVGLLAVAVSAFVVFLCATRITWTPQASVKQTSLVLDDTTPNVS
ncbi:MFS transporter [Kutzneria buriramensis]|uniref:Fucose permease n=1 Tax=Kutzneria buriramensis TaxID=1045776 RepID=A0A3E0H027_9PSEU|nr:MFS transporter [Kutzneria buriramensis]REH35672.1 fucose permease [Kutzneria buriramensis]